MWEPSAHESLGAAVAWWLASEARGLPSFLEDLRRAITLIEAFPSSGRLVSESGDSQLRTTLVEPYRLAYRVTETSIHLILLQHTRRDPGPSGLSIIR